MDFTPYTDDELLRRVDQMHEAELTPLAIELSFRLRRALDEVGRMEAEGGARGNDAGGPREGGREEVAANEGRVVLLASKQRHGQARHS